MLDRRLWPLPLILAGFLASAARADDPPPDPRALLKGAEQARLKVDRGRMVLDVTDTSALFGVVKRRLTVVFDGARRRIDDESRSLSLDWIRGSVNERAAKRRRLEELRGGPEAIVRDGLGSWGDWHNRAVFDGTRFTRFSSINGGELTLVDNPREMRGGEAFDPRVLGLSSGLHPSHTVANYLAVREGETVTLVGRDSLDGLPAWHVRGVHAARGSTRDLWIEPGPSYRVLKVEYSFTGGRQVITSTYGPPGPGAALPVRTVARSVDPDGSLRSETIMQRLSASFDDAIPPGTWTETTFPVGPEKPRPPAKPAALLEVARLDAGSPLAFDALAEIGRGRDPAPEIVAAIGLLVKNHASTSGVGEIAMRALDLQPRGVEWPGLDGLFRAILTANPRRDDQGQACFGLASLLKARSDRLGTPLGDADRVEAEALLDRAASAFGDVKRAFLFGPIANYAVLMRDEMRALGIGKATPPLAGEDLDGKPLALASSRGKVVVIPVWSSGCAPCLRLVPAERELLDAMKGRPFALLGLNLDEDRAAARAAAATHAMAWPSWWKASLAPGWRHQPNLGQILVLDARGVIRFKGLTGEPLRKAVESLLAEGAGAP
jgi:hypothetical protein